VNTSDAVLPLVDKLADENPVFLARYLESLTDGQASVFLNGISAASVMKIIRHQNPAYAARILGGLSEECFRGIVEGLDAQRGADILMELPEEKRKALLQKMDGRRKSEIRELLSYPEDSAGRIMSRDFIALPKEMTVRDAVQRVRELAAKGSNAFYVYVVDGDRKLAGVMNMRDMLLAQEAAPLGSVMRKNVFFIDSFMDREQIANELTTRRFFAAPVVDRQMQLLGVVKSDQIIGEMQEEATEDMQKLFGAGGDEKVFSPMGFSIKKRLPWLHVNLITAFLAASVVALFEDVIARITILAVFLPVVAGQGGNAGAQSLAVVMRGLVMREIPKGQAGRLVMKETLLGAVHGVVIGLVTAAVAWGWYGNPMLGLVIGLGMIVNLIAAGFAGAAIPIAMKQMGLDPAQSSSIVLTTVTDIVGFFAFLGFAVMFQSYLV